MAPCLSFAASRCSQFAKAYFLISVSAYSTCHQSIPIASSSEVCTGSRSDFRGFGIGRERLCLLSVFAKSRGSKRQIRPTQFSGPQPPTVVRLRRPVFHRHTIRPDSMVLRVEALVIWREGAQRYPPT